MDAPLLRRQVHTGLLAQLDGSEEIVQNILRFLRFRADFPLVRRIEQATKLPRELVAIILGHVPVRRRLTLVTPEWWTLPTWFDYGVAAFNEDNFITGAYTLGGHIMLHDMMNEPFELS